MAKSKDGASISNRTEAFGDFLQDGFQRRRCGFVQVFFRVTPSTYRKSSSLYAQEKREFSWGWRLFSQNVLKSVLYVVGNPRGHAEGYNPPIQNPYVLCHPKFIGSGGSFVLYNFTNNESSNASV